MDDQHIDQGNPPSDGHEHGRRFGRARRSRHGAPRSRFYGRVAVFGSVLLAGLLGLSSAPGASEPITETPITEILINPASGPTIPIIGRTFGEVALALIPPTIRIPLPSLGALGPIDIVHGGMLKIYDDWKIGLSGTEVELDVGSTTKKTIDLDILLSWADETDTIPIVTFTAQTKRGGLISGPATTLSVDELFWIADGLISGSEAVAPTWLSDVALEYFGFAFQWDNDAPGVENRWLDLTGTIKIRDGSYSALLSIESDGTAPDPVVLTGLKLDPDPGAEEATMVGAFDGPFAGIAGQLEIPEFIVATVFPETVTLHRDDLRNGIPTRFFASCDTCKDELPTDFAIEPGLSLLVNLDIAKLGPAAAELFDYDPAASTVQLHGRVGISLSDFRNRSPVDLENLELRAHIPAVSAVNQLLPWLSTGPWTLSLKYDHDSAAVEMSAAADLQIDIDDGSAGFDTVFETQATFSGAWGGDVALKLSAVSARSWEHPFGIDWMDLSSVGLRLELGWGDGGLTVEGGLTSTFDLCAAYSPGGCTAYTEGKVQVGLKVDEDADATFRISLGEGVTDVPIGAFLDVVANEFSLPDLGDTLNNLRLEELAMAVRLKINDAAPPTLTFETRATSPDLIGLGRITTYLYVTAGHGTNPTFFVGAAPAEGANLGQLINAPGLEALNLPAFGLIVAPLDGFTSEFEDLTYDGYEFFRDLYGCGEKPATACAGRVEIDPGVNLVANIAFPQTEGNVLFELGKSLGIDMEQGIQFSGTLSLPTLFTHSDPSLGIALRLQLPRFNDGDVFEFIEGGSLHIELKLVADPAPSIAVALGGELDTRWRRGEALTPTPPDAFPLTAGHFTCDAGVPMAQYEDSAIGDDWYCYDRITLGVEGELSLDTNRVAFTILGTVESGSGGWQDPFGLADWLVIHDLTARLQFAYTFNPPPAQIEVNLGFGGRIELDNGDPNLANTQLQASFSAGVAIQTGVPTPIGISATPTFQGIRAYFSRLGTADVALLQKMITGDTELINFSAVPDFELRNGGFMLATQTIEELCLTQGFGIAAELWINAAPAPGQTAVPDESGGCVPFTELVSPEACEARQGEGCFAALNLSLGTDEGIIAAGTVGDIDFGPLTWESALVDLRLGLSRQTFAIHGGISIDGLGAGRLAAQLEPDHIEFFGYVNAFGVAEAQVSGGADLNFSLFPPKVAPDARTQASFRSGFLSEITDQMAARLLEIGDKVRAIEATWNALISDPVGALADARAHLLQLGIPVPNWMDPLLNAIAAVEAVLPAGQAMPAIEDFFGIDYIGIEYPAVSIATCPEGYFYEPVFTQQCQWINPFTWPRPDPVDPTWEDTCPFGGTLSGSSCVVGIDLSDLSALVTSWSAALSELSDGLAGWIAGLDLVPAGFSLSEYIDKLADAISNADVVELNCASFGFQTGDDANVELATKVTLLGKTYGFDIDMDLRNPVAGVTSLLDSLLQIYFTGGSAPSACLAEQPPPVWVPADEITEPAFLSIELMASPAVIDEGGQVELVGHVAPTNVDPVDITIDWGDGTTATLPGPPDLRLTHTYRDDRAAGLPDVFTITASIGGSAVAYTTVSVHNVAPTIEDLVWPKDGFQEGLSGEISFRIADPGLDDEHIALIDWGDGSTEKVLASTRELTFSHIYADDRPNGTPSDAAAITVLLRDDDGGIAEERCDTEIRNVAPVVTAIEGPADPSEGDSGTYTVRFTDPGTEDVHWVGVDWGDGTISSVKLVPGITMATFDHLWFDDDPTGTLSDDMAVAVMVLDDDTGEVSESYTVTVHNVAPVLSFDHGLSIEVQYSDPLFGGEEATVSFIDVIPDTYTIGTTFDDGPVPDWLDFADVACVAELDGIHERCTAVLSPTAGASGIHTDVAPGTHTLAVTVEDDDTGVARIELAIEVLPEDAVAWYVGPTFAATTSARDGTADIELRATIRDITSVPGTSVPGSGLWDPWPGDILNATVTFFDVDTDEELCSAEVYLVFPSDERVLGAETDIGVATCVWEADLKNEDAVQFDVGVAVVGYYSNDKAPERTLVTVARPLDDFITGGGYVVLSDSAGLYAGDAGSKANFGFSVKFNKKGTNLQGRVTLLVRVGGRIYRVKSNALRSLGISEENGIPFAQFEAKANLVDVTDPNAPISMGGNLTLQMRMHDLGGGTAGPDTIGFSLWAGHQGDEQLLLFSSNWGGNQTLEQDLAGGNLQIH